MAFNFLEWVAVHADGVFEAFLAIAAIYFVARVIVIIDESVKTYRARRGA